MEPTPPPPMSPTSTPMSIELGPRPPFRDTAGRARTASMWLLVTGAVLAVQLAEYLYLATSYDVTRNLTPIAIDAGLEMVDIVLAILLLVAFIGSIVTFLRWFSRAHANLGSLGFTPRYSNGQAIWTWFVPIFNIWRPKQIANDIWRSGTVDAAPRVPRIADLRTPGWLLAWWLLLLVPAGSYSDDTLLLWIVFAGTLAPSAFLASRFVREATARQRERDARLTRDGFAPSPSGMPTAPGHASLPPHAGPPPLPPQSGPFV